MGLAVVDRFQSLPEAQVACTVLKSAGLPAVLLDDAFSGIWPVEADLPGGLRVCVPEDDLAAATAVLAAARAAGDEAAED